jgi:hypothetical protein
MTSAPERIGRAVVLTFTVIDSRHQPTRNCRHSVNGKPAGPAKGLAICRYENGDGYYLFGCDEQWRTVTDTWHPTIADAKAQAEFEYAGVSVTWHNSG